MKLLSQLERPSDGEILVEGEPVKFRNPQHAQKLGIAMVHQEFALAPHLTIAENLALGREQSHIGLIVRGSEKKRARELLERVKLDVNPGTPGLLVCRWPTSNESRSPRPSPSTPRS